MDFRVYLEPTRATACSTIRAQLGGACATIISSLFSSCLCFISDSTHSLPLLHKGCFALFYLPRVWSFLFLFFFLQEEGGEFSGGTLLSVCSVYQSVQFSSLFLCLCKFVRFLFFFFFTWFFCFSFSFNEFDLGLGWASELLESHHMFLLSLSIQFTFCPRKFGMYYVLFHLSFFCDFFFF